MVHDINGVRGQGSVIWPVWVTFEVAYMMFYRNIRYLELELPLTIIHPLYMCVGCPTVVYRCLFFSSQTTSHWLG